MLTNDSDKQHAALVSGMGGLTPCQATVDAILMPESGKDKRVLDIGEEISPSSQGT